MSQRKRINSPESLARVRQKRIDALGMPLTTATHRLMRAVMVSLLRDLNKDACYRCSEPMSEGDWSIDHKVDWINNDPALFWDVTNISFSHLTCNKRATRSGAPARNPPEGTSWCSKERRYRPVSDFTYSGQRNTGIDYWCKTCKSTSEAKRRNAAPPR